MYVPSGVESAVPQHSSMTFRADIGADVSGSSVMT